MNGVVKDAYNLCLYVLDAMTPGDKFAIINIGISDKGYKTFNYPDKHDIPTAFGYSYDNVFKVLLTEKIVLASKKDVWFTKVSVYKDNSIDTLTTVGRSCGFLKADEHVNCYRRWYTSHVDNGPQCKGLYSLLVDLQTMRYFVNRQQGILPIFNTEKSSLEYLGQVVEFSGYQARCIQMLISRLNSRVSASELYSYIYEKPESDYMAQVKSSRGKTGTNEPVEKIFDNAKKKVKENNRLKETLIFVQQDGFGLFIDQRKVFVANQ